MSAVELGSVGGDRIEIAAAERDVSVAVADAERAWRSLGRAALIREHRYGYAQGVFGEEMPHARSADHRLGRRFRASAILGGLLASIVLLIVPPIASANFVYWTNLFGQLDRPGEAQRHGLQQQFHSGYPELAGCVGHRRRLQVHLLDRAKRQHRAIGRANLDGTRRRIPTSSPRSGVGLRSVRRSGSRSRRRRSTGPTEAAMGHSTIGNANLDGSNPTRTRRSGPRSRSAASRRTRTSSTGSTRRLAQSIGRAPLGGGTAQTSFVPLSSAQCGVAVDSSFLYWAAADKPRRTRRRSGGTPQPSFIPNAAGTMQSVSGVATNPQYVFWGNNNGSTSGNFIGRANLGGGSPNPTLIPGASRPMHARRGAIQQDHGQLDLPKERRRARRRSTPRCRARVR